MSCVLDGSASLLTSSGNPCQVTLTTALAGEIVVDICVNGATVSSVIDGAGLIYTKRANTSIPTIESWVAKSLGAHASNVITVNFSTGTSFVTLHAYGVSGCDATNPFDPNAALPDVGNTDPRSITTSNADDMLTYFARTTALSTPSPPTGFTTIVSGGFCVSAYKLVAATQSGVSVSVGSGIANGCIADAMQSAAGGGVTSTASSILKKLSQSASGLEKAIGSSAQVLNHIIQAASGLEKAIGTSAQVLKHVTQSASAQEKFIGTSIQILPHVRQSGLDIRDLIVDSVSNSGYQAAQTSAQWSHTCLGFHNTLVVGISVFTGGETIDAVSQVGGNSLLKVGDIPFGDDTTSIRSELWYIVGPVLGTLDLKVEFSGPVDFVAHAISFQNELWSLAGIQYTGANATNVGATDALANYNALTDNGYVVGVITTDDTTITNGVGQTEEDKVSGAMGTGAMSIKSSVPYGSGSIYWTDVGAGKTWSIILTNIYPYYLMPGVASSILPHITQQASALEKMIGVAAQSLKHISQSATAQETISGFSAQTLKHVLQSGTALERIIANAVQVLPHIRQSGIGDGITLVSGTSIQLLPHIRQSASGVSISAITGLGIQLLPSIEQLARQTPFFSGYLTGRVSIEPMIGGQVSNEPMIGGQVSVN